MAASTATGGPPRAARASDDDLALIDAWWRAANYLSVGQIYLYDNPLLRQPLAPEHIKPRLLGHWGTTPGLNMLWAHLNRVIAARDLDVYLVRGPGHGGPGDGGQHLPRGHLHARSTRRSRRTRPAWAGCSASSRSRAASPATPRPRPRGRSTRAASWATPWPTPTAPPSTTRGCWWRASIGDGEAETGPLAASWHSNKLLDPAADGAVLPILHLNGYKIANPTVLARIPESELVSLLTGYGHTPFVVSGDDPADVHRQLADTLDEMLDAVAEYQDAARGRRRHEPPAVADARAAHPKGWTGPRWSTASRSRAPGARTRCRWRACATTPST